MMKIIDFIEGNIDALSFPQFSHTIVVEGKKEGKVTINFDIRESYAMPQGERIYSIEEKGGAWWVKYNKENIVIGIKAMGECTPVKKWREQKYPFDKKRNSPPFSMWTYQVVEVRAKKIIIAAGESEEEVLNELKKFQVSRAFHHSPSANDKFQEEKDAYLLAKESLLSLRVYNKERELLGLYAGLPWFFQFWVRDTAVAVKALGMANRWEAKAFLSENSFSSLQNASYKDLAGHNKGLKSPDGQLWFLLRSKESRIANQDSFYCNTDFITNGPKETWMDTIPREGARIELQALKLALLKGTLPEKEFREKVRSAFLQNGVLVDGIEKDGTIDWAKRPNVFLAAYIYPSFLSQKEWEKVFDVHLRSLWLLWGGLATFDTKHPDFCALHTGEDSQSYHKGDSWFWINNLAAIGMQRVNPKKYARYVKKIFEASSRDILKGQIPGHASELSSASRFESAGSPAQLWSAATFIELYKELHKV